MGGGNDLSSKISKLSGYNFIKNSKKGAILIEFAFAVPILFSLIYYVHDLSKMKRYNERMYFVGHQMASMIQNISQNRADKKITNTDLRNIISASYMTIYPGDTQFWVNKGYPGPGFVHGQIFCVVCDSNGKASVKWHLQYQYGGGCTTKNPASVKLTYCTSDDSRSQVRHKSNVNPSEIYPSLSMQPNEVKIIVAPTIFFSPHWSSEGKSSSGKPWSQISPREEFGFYFISPSSSSQLHFEKVIIFTPKPGLFSETPPQ